MRIRTLLAAAAVTLVFAPALPARAITFGHPDGDAHPNVGSLVGLYQGHEYQWCTGTLISPTVFLTASHCFDGFIGAVPFTVTFDSVIDADHDGMVDPGVTLLRGTPRMHPLYASGGANNTYDVAVFVLDEPVAGVTPARLPDMGYLDSKDAKRAGYTTVGYGTVRDSKRSGPAFLSDGTERAAVEQTVNSVTKSWVTFSMNPSTGNGGTCYGDSGGPHFAGAGTDDGGLIVALTVTGDRWCRSTDKSYRLDTTDAQDFLAIYLG
jgi:hypothetical protein